MVDMEQQMRMLEQGGLNQEGGSIDPISGNEVPFGSLEEEVRDDIDAKLSEGEFVFPADVVRYIGLENLMKLRQKAKEGLGEMEAMGQMGNSDEATMDDESDFDDEVNRMIDEFDPNALEEEEEMAFAPGGYVPGQSGYIPQASPGISPPPPMMSPKTRVPTGAQLLGTPTGTAVPAYTSRQYIGPTGDIITITLINGVPVQPIPEGYQPYTGQPITPQVQAPKVQATQDQGGDGKTREEEEQEAREFEQYKANAATLAAYDPKFAEVWANDPNNKRGTNYGGFPSWSDVFASVKTGMSMTDSIETIGKDLGIDLTDYENTGISRLGGKYDVEAFTKNLNDMAEDLEAGRIMAQGEKESADRATKAAQVREDFRAREEAEDAAFREGRTESQRQAQVDAEAERQRQQDEAQDARDRAESARVEAAREEAQRQREQDERDDSGRDGDQGDVTGASEGFGGGGNFGFAKGGLAAPKTPRKPKAKQTTSTRGKGLARKK
jgi:hypothetical protein